MDRQDILMVKGDQGPFSSGIRFDGAYFLFFPVTLRMTESVASGLQSSYCQKSQNLGIQYLSCYGSSPLYFCTGEYKRPGLATNTILVSFFHTINIVALI